MSGNHDEVRRGLEAAALGLKAMSALMDRLGDLLEDWNKRALTPGSRTADMWLLAVNELRAVVTPASASIAKATAMAPVQRESSWTMADARRGYDA